MPPTVRESLLADFWYPDARAGAFGVRWVENCVRSADNGAWVDFRNSLAQGARLTFMAIFNSCQLGLIRLTCAIRQRLNAPGAMYCAGTGSACISCPG
ncbi:Oxidoreductase [Klebsiella aerogenes]|nr:Oxidoreductase [Klebsiella aerogenes]